MFSGRSVKGKEIILGSMFYLESFQMIAKGVSKFLSYYLHLTVCRRVYFSKKKTKNLNLKNLSFVKDVLFYPYDEEGAFPPKLK